MNATTTHLAELPSLLRGETESASTWVEQPDARRLACWLAIIVAGSALYGAAMGWWRAPLQAAYTAAKFPLVLLLTTLGNALLNGMVAPLLGLNISFRQSLLAVLMSFTIAAAILGAFSPLLFFLVWNTPPLELHAQAVASHSLILVAETAVIAFAGVAANLRLHRHLRHLAGSEAVARRVLFAWLAGNLFLGSQLSWALRPFVGSPGLPVEFLRPDALHGSFFEALFRALRHLS